MLSSKLNVMSYELCKDILTINDNIMFVAVINEKGRIGESQGRDSIIEKLPSIRKEMFLMERALMHRMRQEFDEDLGSVRYTYAEREKRGILSFPMDEQFLLVSFLTCVDSSSLAKSIIRLIDKCEEKLK